jgi:hypothetical protein
MIVVVTMDLLQIAAVDMMVVEALLLLLAAVVARLAAAALTEAPIGSEPLLLSGVDVLRRLRHVDDGPLVRQLRRTGPLVHGGVQRLRGRLHPLLLPCCYEGSRCGQLFIGTIVLLISLKSDRFHTFVTLIVTATAAARGCHRPPADACPVT